MCLQKSLEVGEILAVFIIAEAGVNHNGSVEIAKKLIDIAAEAGCDAVKFQTFSADKLVTKDSQMAEYQKANTKKDQSQYEMLKKLELSYADFLELKEYCEFKGIQFLSTPFDEDAVDSLEELEVEIYKISSGDITNKPFLKHVAKKHKPIILSTGMSTMEEIKEAVAWIYEEGNKDVTLLHCTSSYPTLFSEVNLKAIGTLKNRFNTRVGYSDHTLGIEVSIAAVAVGAEVIEKHFTLDNNMEGPDHKASLEPDELVKLVKSIRNIELAMGNGEKIPSPKEIKIMKVVRKSIVTKEAINKGTIISEDMLCYKRPGTGIEPKSIHLVINRVSVKDLPKDHVLSFEDLYI